jgi:hypothetical protein
MAWWPRTACSSSRQTPIQSCSIGLLDVAVQLKACRLSWVLYLSQSNSCGFSMWWLALCRSDHILHDTVAQGNNLYWPAWKIYILCADCSVLWSMGQNNMPNTFLEALTSYNPDLTCLRFLPSQFFFLFFRLMTFGTQPPRDFWERIIMALVAYLYIVDGTWHHKHVKPQRSDNQLTDSQIKRVLQWEQTHCRH